jgi:hypothetical protein
VFKPEDLIALTQAKAQDSPFRLGTVDPGYASGRPKVTFDGETTLSVKTYPYLSSYTPIAGHRVLLAAMGSTWVVLGRVL